MERRRASDFPQELIDLLNRYVHGGISRRQFLRRAEKFAVGGVTAAALFQMLRPNYAWAIQVPPDDKRIKSETVTVPSPHGNGSIKGYLVRPATADKLPAIIVIHENRGLNPYVKDVARRLAVAGFPNLFTITGPQSPSVLANMPVAIEQHVEWIADCISYMREHGLTTVEAVPAAQDNWVAHVNEVVNGTLLPLGNSWWMSANIPGKPRAFLPYLGPEGIGGYRKRCAEIAAKGYEGFLLA